MKTIIRALNNQKMISDTSTSLFQVSAWKFWVQSIKFLWFSEFLIVFFFFSQALISHSVISQGSSGIPLIALSRPQKTKQAFISSKRWFNVCAHTKMFYSPKMLMKITFKNWFLLSSLSSIFCCCWVNSKNTSRQCSKLPLAMASWRGGGKQAENAVVS